MLILKCVLIFTHILCIHCAEIFKNEGFLFPVLKSGTHVLKLFSSVYQALETLGSKNRLPHFWSFQAIEGNRMIIKTSV